MTRLLACLAALALLACTSGDAPTSEPVLEGSAPVAAAAEPDPGSGSGEPAAEAPAEGSSEEAPAEGSAAAAPVDARIVSLIPAATELLFAMGAGEDVVGRSMHCDYPPAVEQLPSIGSGLAPDLERIVSLRPTHAVGSQLQADSPQVQALVDAGISVVLIPDQSLEDIATALALLGGELGRVESARAEVARLERELLAVQSAVRGRDRPYVFVPVGRDPLYAAGSDSFIGEVVDIAGGQNVLPGDWVQIDDEILATLAPDVIIEGDTQPDDGFWFRYRTLPAVQNDRFCGVNGDTLARPGPRLAEAAESIARCLHPGALSP